VQRAVVVVALVALLSGCNALGGTGGNGAATDSPVVSPAPVPSQAPTASTATERPGTCLAPPPATPGPSTATTPAEPAALPGTGDVVNGSALVDHHARTLATQRFHLRIGNGTNVWAMPRAAAFTYEGFELGLKTSRAYAAGGTLYTLDLSRGDYRVVREPYRTGSPTNQRLLASLTGRTWLADRLARYDYAVVDTRTWNGVDVRVLRDTLEQRLLLGPESPYNGLLDVNSTVYVDRRGIVRRVRHVRDLEIQVGIDEYENVTQVHTLRVPSVGSTRVFRPADFCVRDPDSVTVGTPTDRDTSRDLSQTPTGTVVNATAASGTVVTGNGVTGTATETPVTGTPVPGETSTAMGTPDGNRTATG